jgi:hypothetical protein
MARMRITDRNKNRLDDAGLMPGVFFVKQRGGQKGFIKTNIG